MKTCKIQSDFRQLIINGHIHINLTEVIPFTGKPSKLLKKINFQIKTFIEENITIYIPHDLYSLSWLWNRDCQDHMTRQSRIVRILTVKVRIWVGLTSLISKLASYWSLSLAHTTERCPANFVNTALNVGSLIVEKSLAVSEYSHLDSV